MDAASPIREHEVAELLVLVEALSNARPIPAGCPPVVVVHAIEVRAPAHSRPGGNVLQRRQERVRDEELRAPPFDRCVRLFRSADGARRFSNEPVTLVAPRPPAQELPAEIRNEN